MCKDRGLPWSQRRWNTKILCDIYIFFIDFLLSRIELETLTEDKRRVNRNVCSVFLALWSQAHKRSLFTLCYVCLKPPPHLSVRAEPPPSSQVSPSSPRYVLLWPSLGIPPPFALAALLLLPQWRPGPHTKTGFLRCAILTTDPPIGCFFLWGGRGSKCCALKPEMCEFVFSNEPVVRVGRCLRLWCRHFLTCTTKHLSYTVTTCFFPLLKQVFPLKLLCCSHRACIYCSFFIVDSDSDHLSLFLLLAFETQSSNLTEKVVTKMLKFRLKFICFWILEFVLDERYWEYRMEGKKTHFLLQRPCSSRIKIHFSFLHVVYVSMLSE